MRPSSWNGVGAIAKVPAAAGVSFVICLYLCFVMDRGQNLRADFLTASSEKKISRACSTMSCAFQPVCGGFQPSISIMRISRTPRGAGDAEHLAGLVPGQITDHV